MGQTKYVGQTCFHRILVALQLNNKDPDELCQHLESLMPGS